MLVHIVTSQFDPLVELDQYQRASVSGSLSFGATAIFIGTMRDFNDGESVDRMVLEHYPGMTERQLEAILVQAAARWPILDALVIHRVGEIFPGDPIVLVVVWAAHRGAAFDACRAVVEELKTRAPFWKKETLPKGDRWVEANTSGY
ncbi:MAG: molybdenum cofactor biosynthesis protein MoaE [Methylotetracoccus sp.]